MKYVDLSKELQLQVLEQTRSIEGLDQQVIEKDWWVTQVLRALFALPYSELLSFKGGTSLSKCWRLIERFSEDIDIGISREFLGFEGELSKTQISDKLRRAACLFVREHLQYDVRNKMLENGISPDLFEVSVDITPVTTTDPEIILVSYKSVLPTSEYIRHAVKIEVIGRSTHEPVVEHNILSMIVSEFPETPFAEDAFKVWAVIPQRTFLEKMFLLHEEFAKPTEEIRAERMSRHMYDLERMMRTPIAKEALLNTELYNVLIEHRRKFIGLRGFDYNTLQPGTLNILPPTPEIEQLWRDDYRRMQDTMIYGESIGFDELKYRLNTLCQSLKNKNIE